MRANKITLSLCSFLALGASVHGYAETNVGARPRGGDTTRTTTTAAQTIQDASMIDPKTGKPYDQRLQNKFDNYKADNALKESDYGTGSGDTSVNQGAKSAQTMQMVGAAVNAAAGVYFFSKCGPQHTFNCLAGAMSVATAGMMLQGAGDTQGAIDYSQYDPGSIDWPKTGGPSGSGRDTNGGTGGLNPTGRGANDPWVRDTENKIRQVQAGLREKGYKISPDGRSVTTPDGKTIPGSALSTPEGMASLGMTPEQISEMNADNKMLAAQAKEKIANAAIILGEDEGGGGGAARKAGGRGGSEKEFDYAALFAEKKDKKKEAANVSGLSKQFGDSRIGVPQDNIFDMVRRQYVKQDGAQNFIQSRPARQPMSIPRRPSR